MTALELHCFFNLCADCQRYVLIERAEVERLKALVKEQEEELDAYVSKGDWHW